ncbi:hypothetical protein GQ43DRAFT_464041 [Delitschia confertaspora ATCC 74209]|uniref:Uncharacterized protein n=1 Tax=Delitschia confertaspora ATCC 74209 TaxID=1513339 RepID=A0A9P4JNJ7_9PLEO|nr:hypothetical protein GQ43DRAFT_464041 [Delitschia confertaspora ATCC 74209]
MTPSCQCLSPTSSLPPIRTLNSLTEKDISSALHNLRSLYCPLRVPLILQSRSKSKEKFPSAPHTPADSGYASDDEDEDPIEDTLAVLRADVFERDFAVRWLTSLIARAEQLKWESEDAMMRVIDDAASILASFTENPEEDEEEDPGMTRNFSFATPYPGPEIRVQLNDAPLSGTDHTDVGLQSWGASIILASLMCLSPARFALDQPVTGSVIELGAGTGLISLVLAKLLPTLGVSEPTVIATDYHPAVLSNLAENVKTNFPKAIQTPVKTCLLDWSAPSLSPPLDIPARLLVAADVIYAPEHATWLRDCASRLLAPNGHFWLIATVRPSGRFAGLVDTVEAAFTSNECGSKEDGPKLRILEAEKLEKRKGVGRGDESGYVLYKIGWA